MQAPVPVSVALVEAAHGPPESRPEEICTYVDGWRRDQLTNRYIIASVLVR